jgi:hypothetical protein
VSEFDFGALERDPTGEELRRVQVDARRGRFGRESRTAMLGPTGASCVALVAATLLVAVFLVVLVAQLVGGDGPTGAGLAVTGGGALVSGAVWWLARRRAIRDWPHSVRLALFAQANDLRFQVRSRASSGAGAPRDGGTDRDLLQWEIDGRRVRMGVNHAGVKVTHYLAVRVERTKLPAGSFTAGVLAVDPDHRQTARNADRLPLLFDTSVTSLLLDPRYPCDATFGHGWFRAIYTGADWHDADRVRHGVALADAVAARAHAMSG